MKKLLSTLILATGVSLAILPAAQAETTQNASETAPQYVASSGITAEIKTKLLAKKKIDSNDIIVQSVTDPSNKDMNIVTLTGCQKTKHQVKLAVATVKKVKSVSHVKNDLQVTSTCGE